MDEWVTVDGYLITKTQMKLFSVECRGRGRDGVEGGGFRRRRRKEGRLILVVIATKKLRFDNEQHNPTLVSFLVAPSDTCPWNSGKKRPTTVTPSDFSFASALPPPRPRRFLAQRFWCLCPPSWTFYFMDIEISFYIRFVLRWRNVEGSGLRNDHRKAEGGVWAKGLVWEEMVNIALTSPTPFYHLNSYGCCGLTGWSRSPINCRPRRRLFFFFLCRWRLVLFRKMNYLKK